MKTRFVEPQPPDWPHLGSVADEFLVVCPACEACARVAPAEAQSTSFRDPRRLVCAKCGLVKKSPTRSSYSFYGPAAIDPYFELPLWFSTTFRGKSLWFYNERHMELVEQYVRAELRVKRCHPEYGWYNGSMYNRLPKFIKEAGNRDEVLKAIEMLRQK